MAIVEVRDLFKHYGQVKAVDGISFAVERGEVFGMLGPNGAGKTTSVEIIEGLRPMDRGSVRVMDMDPHRDRKRVRNITGMQLQSTSLIPRLTAREHLALFAAFYPKTRDVDGLIELVGLEERASGLTKDLSGGQQQRLSLALALVNDPEVVFLDEPTTGMDPQARRHLWDVIADMRKQGKTVFLTTHYMEEAEVLCDRVAVIDHGRIIALDTPSRLISSHFQESTVSFEAPDQEVDSAALRGLPAVTSIVQANGQVELFSKDVAATVSALMDFAEQRQLRLQGLSVGKATLEDVFLKITGRRIRD